MDHRIVKISERKARCDGGEAGHPVVYLNIGPKDEVICPYCSKIFRFEKGRK